MSRLVGSSPISRLTVAAGGPGLAAAAGRRHAPPIGGFAAEGSERVRLCRAGKVSSIVLVQLLRDLEARLRGTGAQSHVVEEGPAAVAQAEVKSGLNLKEVCNHPSCHTCCSQAERARTAHT
eukprot:6003372-Pyramimonas_sp.AAC.1